MVCLELIHFRWLGQRAVPEQEDDFLKRSVVRQSVDVVAAVTEDAGIPIDVANLRLAGDHAFQTRHCCAHAAPVPSFYSMTYQPPGGAAPSIYCGQPGSGEKPIVRSSRCTQSLSSCFLLESTVTMTPEPQDRVLVM